MHIEHINRINLIGDSLSDRGEAFHRKIFFSLFSFSVLAGLKGSSPKGRFTNGLTWSDALITMLKQQLFIDKHPGRKDSGTSLADDIITGNLDVIDDVNLGNYKHARANYRDFINTFCEGGLTSHNYFGKFTWNIILYFSRMLLSNLDQQRQRLIAEDEFRGITDEQKETTLTIEWSGANDLFTVNSEPTEQEALDAVNARLDNIEKLLAQGYKNFVLFSLPDLALTPRYQSDKKTDEDRANATRVANYFNAELKQKIKALKKKYPDAAIDVFNINETFSKIYQDPAFYGFDPEKKKTPFKSSKDFNVNGDNTSHADGYMFWDDVHPTMHMHSLLANEFYAKFIYHGYGVNLARSEEDLPHPPHNHSQIYLYIKDAQLHARVYHKALPEDCVIDHGEIDSPSAASAYHLHQVQGTWVLEYYRRKESGPVPFSIDKIPGLQAAIAADDQDQIDQLIKAFHQQRRHHPVEDINLEANDQLSSELIEKHKQEISDMMPGLAAKRVSLSEQIFEYLAHQCPCFPTKQKYEITAPGPKRPSLVDQFRTAYADQWFSDQARYGIFRVFARRTIYHRDPNLTLERIFRHALNEKGHRSRAALEALGWIDKSGKLTKAAENNPELKAAMASVSIAYTKPVFKPEFTADTIEKDLVEHFRHAYEDKFSQEQGKYGPLRFFLKSNIHHLDPNLTLNQIFEHALTGQGGRTRAVIENLGWINKDGALTEKARSNPILSEYFQAEHQTNISLQV